MLLLSHSTHSPMGEGYCFLPITQPDEHVIKHKLPMHGTTCTYSILYCLQFNTTTLYLKALYLFTMWELLMKNTLIFTKCELLMKINNSHLVKKK